MKKFATGFTIVELMIVVAIIGILAYIGLPMYQGYTMRAKVAELILAAGSAKNIISEKSRESSVAGGTGVEAPAAAGKLSAASVGVSDGVIELRGVNNDFGNQDVVVRMTPSWDSNASKIVWTCSVTPASFETSNCAAD